MRARSHNVADRIHRYAVSAPEHPAVVDGERSLGYREFEARCARLAGVLAAAGLGEGERVALLLANRSAYLEAVFGAARLGAIAVPINNRLAVPEIARQLTDCAPRALLYESELTAKAEPACASAEEPIALRLAVGGAPDLYERALADAVPFEEIRPVSTESPLMILYTSGTTGFPKGALLPHRKTFYNSLNAEIFFELSSDSRVLVAVPLFHSLGLNILTVPTLFAGGTVFLARRFDPAEVWRAVEAQRITFLGGVPTMFRALFEVLDAEAPDRFDLGSLRFLFTAGAAIPVELIRAYEERGLILKQGFGQTETSILCCLDARDALRKAGSVGRPVAHGEVRIVRIDSATAPVSSWRDVGPGEVGEIVVRGPITMLGYWNQPEASAETLRDGWLRTGDLATRDAEGFFTLVGREKDMFISGGENVYPAEVEAILAEHPQVREIAVVGHADPTWGEVGRAYVVAVDRGELDGEALRTWAREHLASFKIPKTVVIVDSLPRTVSGKVQKHRLGERAAAVE